MAFSRIHLSNLYCFSTSLIYIVLSIFSCVILYEKLHVPNKALYQLLISINEKTCYRPSLHPQRNQGSEIIIEFTQIYWTNWDQSRISACPNIPWSHIPLWKWIRKRYLHGQCDSKFKFKYIIWFILEVRQKCMIGSPNYEFYVSGLQHLNYHRGIAFNISLRYFLPYQSIKAKHFGTQKKKIIVQITQKK